MHRHMDEISITAGSGIYDGDGLCPPFSSPNTNMFASTFGIEFVHKSNTFVRPFSTYEYARCFRLDGDLTYALSHAANFSLLHTGVPSRTGRLLLTSILSRLDVIRTEGFDLHNSPTHHTLAVTACAPIYTSEAIKLTHINWFVLKDIFGKLLTVTVK